jgi:hypothetical protein
MVITITEKPDYESFPLRSKSSLEYVVATKTDGSDLVIPIEVVVGSPRDPKLVAIAGVHGDEIDGIVALQETWKEIDPAKLRGTLIVVPVANPPAVRAGRRCSPEDDLDLNRAFPGKLAGSVSQQLAHHLFHDVVMVADMVATFHGWRSNGVVIPYTEFPDGIGDPEIEAASLEAAKAFGFEVLRVTSDKPGRLLPEATRAGIPTIESEIGGLGISEEDNRQRYHAALFDLMRHLEMWPGEVKRRARSLIVRDREVNSPADGLLRHQVTLNTWVDEGQVLAIVCDLHGQFLTEIQAPNRALVATQRRWPIVVSGDRVCTLFQEIPDYPGPVGVGP